LPRYPLPRRFAWLLASALLAGAAWSFHAGHAVAGSILGWIVVTAGLVNVGTGFSPGAFLYAVAFGTVASHKPPTEPAGFHRL